MILYIFSISIFTSPLSINLMSQRALASNRVTIGEFLNIAAPIELAIGVTSSCPFESQRNAKCWQKDATKLSLTENEA